MEKHKQQGPGQEPKKGGSEGVHGYTALKCGMKEQKRPTDAGHEMFLE